MKNAFRCKDLFLTQKNYVYQNTNIQSIPNQLLYWYSSWEHFGQYLLIEVKYIIREKKWWFFNECLRKWLICTYKWIIKVWHIIVWKKNHILLRLVFTGGKKDKWEKIENLPHKPSVITFVLSPSCEPNLRNSSLIFFSLLNHKCVIIFKLKKILSIKVTKKIKI